MGTVFRKSYTKPIPRGAEIVAKGGRRVARWRARNKLRQAAVTTGNDGTDRIVLESPYYVAKYRDGYGVVREVSTGCRDEQAARRVLADLERKAELIRSGVITPTEDAAGRYHTAPLESHFGAFEQRQKARGVDDKYHENTMRGLRRVAAACGFTTLADLSCGPFERWLVERAAAGMAARTRNAYREALVVFCNWCVESGRLAANPFVRLPKANTKADPRRQRRPLTEDELRRLLTVAATRALDAKLAINRGERKGQAGARLAPATRARLERAGRERVLIYKTLVLTGLRKGELGSLTAGQLVLGDPPHVRLRAADEKNRQGCLIPLRDDLAADLRGWLAEKLAETQAAARRTGHVVPTALHPDTPLFAVPVHLVRNLKKDLKAAGIPARDEKGLVVDVHALRHTFGTLLALGGVTPRVTKELMRHSDPRLTNNVYTHLRLSDTRGALDALPELSVNRPGAGPLAPPLAPTRCKPGHSPSPGGTIGQPSDGPEPTAGGDITPSTVNEKAPLTTAVISGASFGETSREVAAVGFEPTTSRL